MNKKKTIKAWAIVNWDNSDIVNDGTGQKWIFRTKKLAEEKCKKLKYGTSVVKVEIKPLTL